MTPKAVPAHHRAAVNGALAGSRAWPHMLIFSCHPHTTWWVLATFYGKGDQDLAKVSWARLGAGPLCTLPLNPAFLPLSSPA